MTAAQIRRYERFKRLAADLSTTDAIMLHCALARRVAPIYRRRYRKEWEMGRALAARRKP